MIDTAQINSNIDLVEVAKLYTVLHKVGANEWAGPCPKCGGVDRYHVRPDGFFCRKCHTGATETGKERFSDAIAHEQWLNGISFVDAVNRLQNGPVLNAPAKPRPKQPAKKEAVNKWRSAEWQGRARRLLEPGQDSLWNLSTGQQGRDELEKRGIRLDMAIAYGLGYADVWNIKAGCKMPALLIPWQNRQVTAIQYRFIGVKKDDDTADRFGQLRGGARLLFGLQHCFDLPGYRPHTLFIIEGELNALSCAQSIRDMGLPIDAVSFGPEGNIRESAVVAVLSKITPRYRHIIIWTDDPDVARGALVNLPDTTLAVRSLPKLEEGKQVIDENDKPVSLDANDLLKAGRLDDIIWDLIQHVSGGNSL